MKNIEFKRELNVIFAEFIFTLVAIIKRDNAEKEVVV